MFNGAKNRCDAEEFGAQSYSHVPLPCSSRRPSWPAMPSAPCKPSDPAVYSGLKAPEQMYAPGKEIDPEMLLLAEKLVQAVINPDLAGKSNGHKSPAADGRTKHAVLTELSERIAAKLALLSYKEREVFDLLLIQRMSVSEVSFVMFRDSSQEAQSITAGILKRIPELSMLSERCGISLEALVEEIQRIDGEQDELDEENLLVPNYTAEFPESNSPVEPQNINLKQARHDAAELAAPALRAMAADGFGLTELLSITLDQLPHRVTELPLADSDSRSLNSQSVQALTAYLEALRMLGLRNDGLDGTGRLFPLDVFARHNPFNLEEINQTCQKSNRIKNKSEAIKPPASGSSNKYKKCHASKPLEQNLEIEAPLKANKNSAREVLINDPKPAHPPETTAQTLAPTAAMANKSLIDQQAERFFEKHRFNLKHFAVCNAANREAVLEQLLNEVKTIRKQLNDETSLNLMTVCISDMRLVGKALDHCLELISATPRGPRSSPSPGAYEHLNMEIPMLTCGRLKMLESLADNSAESSGTVSVETLLLQLLLAADTCLSALKSDSLS